MKYSSTWRYCSNSFLLLSTKVWSMFRKGLFNGRWALMSPVRGKEGSGRDGEAGREGGRKGGRWEVKGGRGEGKERGRKGEGKGGGGEEEEGGGMKGGKTGWGESYSHTL